MPDKSLIIAEKPSVAADLVKALPGKFEKSKTHYESDRYIASYAKGHLDSIEFPEDSYPKNNDWKLYNLPYMPQDYHLHGLD